MKDNITMSLNPLVNYFKKSPKEFTKSDMIKYVEENNIPMVNFHYVAGDGRIKTLGLCFTAANIWSRYSQMGSALTVRTFFQHSFTLVQATFM